MIPVKRILCPTDFSEASYEAIPVANELAEQFSAELLIVNVVLPIPAPGILPTHAPSQFNVSLYEEQLQISSKKGLNKIIEERISEELHARPIVLLGKAADQIAEIAEKERVDLVVIPTHGRTGSHHLVFGSVAEKVVRLATCPVLTGRAPEKEG
jgi:universal stress protein A